MGISLSLLVIPLVNKLIKVHREINGKWFRYLNSLIYLRRHRRQTKSNRVITHDVWKDDVRHCGMLPFPHEWQFDCPNQSKSEDLLIYGVNSTKQSIKIEIKWRTDCFPIKAYVSLRFDDSDGNSYTLEEESDVRHKDREYKASGLAIEILSPFRRKRIRFRGYLTKNGDQLVYVKFRFLWIAMSRVYDFTHDFSDHYMAKEWTKSKGRLPEPAFEDRLEQFGQMKGTFEEDNQPQRILYFWGSIAKKYLSSVPVNRRVIRIIGYNKKGIGFDLGFLQNDIGIGYTFGFLTYKKGSFKKLSNISISKTEFEDLLQKKPNITFKAAFNDKEYEFTIKENKNSLANDLIIDGNEGMCYILEDVETESQKTSVPQEKKKKKSSSLVVGLSEDDCRSVELSGGKGSSLAELMVLSNQLLQSSSTNKFSVANGIVVTTNAYQRLLEEYKDLRKEIDEMEISTDLPKEELRTKCQNLVDSVTNHDLPQIIRYEIESKLEQTFSDYENRLFAVRSSGASEDSEDMSAAGQMTTFLGIKGLDNICESVIKCWSSQFSHIAVEYKRGYGQPVNSPMAVVIQEMVDCDSAGVMFTCDPINGDERVIEITANYGLGESVVSASAEPDTIRVRVDIEANSLSRRRSIRGIETKTIGAKKKLIRLAPNGGTVEEDVDDKNNCCISDELILRLADLGLKVHKHYGNARDIEWGVKGRQIFMLQSRPVTNLDNSYTEYEIMHELDTPHQTEFEIYSRAHWGENFPGSSSWIVFTWVWNNKSGWFRFGLREGTSTEEDYNPFTQTMGIQYNQLMFNLTNGSFDMFSEYPESDIARQMVLAFFGHEIEDPDVLNAFKEFKRNKIQPSKWNKFKGLLNLIHMVFMGPSGILKTVKQYMHDMKYDMVASVRSGKMSSDVLTNIENEYSKISETQFKNHGPCSMGSTFKHMMLRKALEGAMKNNPNFEDDFNLMISSCNDVISAEVPNTLRAIAKSIRDKNRFRELSDKEATEELRNGSDEASEKFRAFLERHGHRGYREFDPMYSTWGEDPTPCVKTIKSLLFGDESQLKPKEDKSVDQVLSELKTPLSFTRRQMIKKLFLPWSRSGVGYRELSKYFMVWMNNKQKEAFRFLAKKMVSEGLIPTPDTFFYLTIEEVERLCNGERDPLIHMRARMRKRVYPKMNKYKFEEFIKGPEMKPRNVDEAIIPSNLTNGTVRMTGTPVSIGCVKARVCVAEDITEADDIQPGDILITYSTDIGWSPYFPLLSGIITEIGGTISHGAVIAREYGIPSLIAVEGACRAFKTGDICVLDTQSQTITKVG